MARLRTTHDRPGARERRSMRHRDQPGTETTLCASVSVSLYTYTSILEFHLGQSSRRDTRVSAGAVQCTMVLSGFRGSGSAMPGPAGSRGSRFRFRDGGPRSV